MSGGTGVQVSMTLDGEVFLDRALLDLEGRATAPLSDPTVVREVVALFRKHVAAAFASEGASTGAPWKPLAASTQADRKRHGYPPAHPILERTGKLERALTIGDGARISTSPQKLVYQLNEDVGYFKYHQSTSPRARLPRRAPVLLTADDRHEIMGPIRLYLTGRPIDGPKRESLR